jgi:N-acyl-D-amino-acid deacylase
MGGSLETRRRAYGDDGWRSRAVEAWRGMGDPLVPRWDTYEIMECRSHPDLVGVSLSDIAAARGRSPFDALLDITLDEPDLGLRVRCILMNDDVEDLRLILNEDHCVLGVSDAGAHVGMLCDAPVPTDLLGPWVRDRQLMPIEKAVRMLTGAQADLFNFPGRGYVAAGAWADLVVFDPDTIGPGPIRRVRDFPADGERLTADQPEGVRHVLVNGQPIRRDASSVEWDPDRAPGHLIGPAPRHG